MVVRARATAAAETQNRRLAAASRR